jgi:thioredoxin reductase (NADPH)
MEDLIIIGAGPVGLYGAILAALHNLKGKIIEANEKVGGQLTSLYPEKNIVDLPGFPIITAEKFINNLEEQFFSNPNHLDLLLDESVIDFVKHDDYIEVITSKNTYLTKCLLITNGMGLFTPRKIGLDNEDTIKNIIYKVESTKIALNKDVIILGGGDSAVDISLLLKDIAKSVTIIHRRNDFRAQSSSVELMDNSSINVLRNKSITSIEEVGDRCKLIIEDNESKLINEIESDLVLVQYGQVPSKDNFPIEKKGGLISVKEGYETSIEKVFACGNICIYPNKVKNITSGLGEVTTAITKIDQIINPTKNIPVHF